MKTTHPSSPRPSSVRSILAVLTALLILATCAVASDDAKESVIYNFTTDFSNPNNSLTADAAGNLYGTAFDGTKYPNGAVFEFSPNQGHGWSETTLVIFNGKDGRYPSTKLILDGQGNIYGSTVEGGSGPCLNGSQYIGCGVIFELSPSSNGKWAYTVLYNFQNGNDGASPEGNLLLDSSGNLYGVTGFTSGPGSNGTVFEVERPAQQNDPWTFKTLFMFNGTNGFTPNSLTFYDGALYGTTSEGGSSNYTGSVFELKYAGGTWNYSLVYALTGGSDGGFPNSVISGPTNVLYGTAGGGEYNYGVVFELTPGSNGAWTESVVYAFTGSTDGAIPASPLIVSGNDKLYGSTNSGGDASACSFIYPYLGCGVVFEIVPSTGTESVLHTFTGPPSDGGGPENSGVIFDKGVLYGTTWYGGNGQCSNGSEVVGCGTVYSVIP
ncbi:MAG: choice-of-anchor tandem repeat GloVer-containing protein [Candidatus Sulfotelmatobacter sp.]